MTGTLIRLEILRERLKSSCIPSDNMVGWKYSQKRKNSGIKRNTRYCIIAMAEGNILHYNMTKVSY